MGEDVIRLQIRLRQLGYFNYRATGLYYTMTEKAVKQYQEQNALSPDGQAGQMTYDDMFTVDAIRKPLSTSALAVSGPGMELDTPVYGQLSTWDEINAIFTEGMAVTVTDFNTGKTYQMTRTGGANHADVEATDSASYDTFIDCVGGEGPQWEKRAVLVTIGGVQYAGSIFGNPSGEDTLGDGNGMSGHTEIYFNGSTSDILGFADRYHNEKVLTAAGEIK
jgi:peptidoglycan hydrolase-like protein with peptidoglycan-binding domain